MLSGPFDEGHVAGDVPTACDLLDVIQCVTVLLKVVVPLKGGFVVCVQCDTGDMAQMCRDTDVVC